MKEDSNSLYSSSNLFLHRVKALYTTSLYKKWEFQNHNWVRHVALDFIWLTWFTWPIDFIALISVVWNRLWCRFLLTLCAYVIKHSTHTLPLSSSISQQENQLENHHLAHQFIYTIVKIGTWLSFVFETHCRDSYNWMASLIISQRSRLYRLQSLKSQYMKSVDSVRLFDELIIKSNVETSL